MELRMRSCRGERFDTAELSARVIRLNFVGNLEERFCHSGIKEGSRVTAAAFPRKSAALDLRPIRFVDAVPHPRACDAWPGPRDVFTA